VYICRVESHVSLGIFAQNIAAVAKYSANDPLDYYQRALESELRTKSDDSKLITRFLERFGLVLLCQSPVRRKLLSLIVNCVCGVRETR